MQLLLPVCNSLISAGATVGAESGTLTFMVGGEPAAADAATPLLRHMGTHVIYCGNHGAGLAAKMCNNLVLAASMAAVAEALAVGKRLGLDPKILTEVCGYWVIIYMICEEGMNYAVTVLLDRVHLC